MSQRLLPNHQPAALATVKEQGQLSVVSPGLLTALKLPGGGGVSGKHSKGQVGMSHSFQKQRFLNELSFDCKMKTTTLGVSKSI